MTKWFVSPLLSSCRVVLISLIPSIMYISLHLGVGEKKVTVKSSVAESEIYQIQLKLLGAIITLLNTRFMNQEHTNLKK